MGLFWAPLVPEHRIPISPLYSTQTKPYQTMSKKQFGRVSYQVISGLLPAELGWGVHRRK